MQNAYLIDFGTLIFPGEYEYDCYNIVYDKKFGYYDDNQWYSLDKEDAIAEAERYIDTMNDRCYAVVSETWLDDDVTQDDIDNGNVPVEHERYLVEDVIYGKGVVDGKIVDLFE